MNVYVTSLWMELKSRWFFYSDLWIPILFILLILFAIVGTMVPIVLRRRKKALQRQIEEVIGLRDGPTCEVKLWSEVWIIFNL